MSRDVEFNQHLLHQPSENNYCLGLTSPQNHHPYECPSLPSPTNSLLTWTTNACPSLPMNRSIFDCPSLPSSSTRSTTDCSSQSSLTNHASYEDLLSDEFLQLLLLESSTRLQGYGNQHDQTPREDPNTQCSPIQSLPRLYKNCIPTTSPSLRKLSMTTPPMTSLPMTSLIPMTSESIKINPSRYKTELCRSYSESGRCRYGAKCQYAHGVQEVRTVVDRHPKYKTERCRTYHETGFCTYGPRCNFVHGEQEHWEPTLGECEPELRGQRYEEENFFGFGTSGSWSPWDNADQGRSCPLPCPGKLGGESDFDTYRGLNNSVGTASQESSSPSSRTGSPVVGISGFESFRVLPADRFASFYGDGVEIPFLKLF